MLASSQNKSEGKTNICNFISPRYHKSIIAEMTLVNLSFLNSEFNTSLKQTSKLFIIVLPTGTGAPVCLNATFAKAHFDKDSADIIPDDTS